ncbi:MAG: 2-phosphosulfolactate phosphatase [Anaerotruncus sp.]|nr:2-phosphosulfolactate phosphatase [Anaerotruncus sp.]
MNGSIKIDAAFIPREVCKSHNPICILIDAVRASCTIATFFDKGAQEIVLIEEEGAYIQAHPEALSPSCCICAEKLDGSRADLAEVSPSLHELHQHDSFTGRKVLFRTTNGSIGVRALSTQGLEKILIGSMLNCDAVAKAAVDMALENGMNICTVCAGREHGQIYCIDDTYCAGALIQSIKKYADSIGCAVDLQDSAKIAHSLVENYASAEAAYQSSASGEIMRRLHMEQDLALCARENVTKVVPYVSHIDKEGNVTIAM